MNVGETVKLTITAFNNGPNGANVKVNYKIPFGLKLLSSQGTGTYNEATGVWNVGVLPAGGNAAIELTIQVNNAGCFVNLVSVYGDLHAFSAKSLNGMVKAFSMKAAAAGSSQASFTFTGNDPGQTSGSGNTLPYDFPDIKPPEQPQPPTQPPNNPPTPPEPQPPSPTPPKDSPQPTSQLGRDIAGVRGIVSQDNLKDTLKDSMNKSVLPEWNPTNENKPEEPAEDPPWWIYAMVVIGALVGAALVITPAGEILQRILNGILASLSSAWLYLAYLGVRFKDFIISTYFRISSEYSNYIAAILQEMVFTPATGIGPTTIVGLGLRTLAIKYPWLEDHIAPVINTLEQLTYQELSQKLKELFNK